MFTNGRNVFTIDIKHRPTPDRRILSYRQFDRELRALSGGQKARLSPIETSKYVIVKKWRPRSS